MITTTSAKNEHPVWRDYETIPFQLVLEGGAMRGMFTCGVIDFLLDRGVIAESVIGTSAGAICGYNYVSGAPGRMAYFSMAYRDDWRFMSWRSKLLTGNYVGSRYIFDTLPNKVEPLDQKWFTESPARLVSVATDMETGRADYHDYNDETSFERGMKYLAAGATMPFANRAVHVDGKVLMDGGVADVIPFRRNLAQYRGRQVVVLTRPRGFRQKTTAEWMLDRAYYAAYPQFAELLGNRFERNNEARCAVEDLHDKGDVFAIWPKSDVVASVAERDQGKLFATYEDGVRTAAELWPQLREFLGIPSDGERRRTSADAVRLAVARGSESSAGHTTRAAGAPGNADAKEAARLRKRAAERRPLELARGNRLLAAALDAGAAAGARADRLVGFGREPLATGAVGEVGAAGVVIGANRTTGDVRYAAFAGDEVAAASEAMRMVKDAR